MCGEHPNFPGRNFVARDARREDVNLSTRGVEARHASIGNHGMSRLVENVKPRRNGLFVFAQARTDLDPCGAHAPIPRADGNVLRLSPGHGDAKELELKRFVRFDVPDESAIRAEHGRKWKARPAIQPNGVEIHGVDERQLVKVGPRPVHDERFSISG